MKVVPVVSGASEETEKEGLLPVPHDRDDDDSGSRREIMGGFAKKAKWWLEREEVTEHRSGLAARILAAAVDAGVPQTALVDAVALTRRAPEPENLVGSLEMLETEALVSQGRLDAESAFRTAGFMGGRGLHALVFWSLWGAAMLSISMSRALEMAGQAEGGFEASFFDVRETAKGTPRWLVPRAVRRCARRCSHRHASRACEHLGGTLPRGPSTVSLSYDAFLPGDGDDYDQGVWLGPRRKWPSEAFQWLDGTYVEEEGLWLHTPPTSAYEDACVFVVPHSRRLWNSTACTTRKAARCEAKPALELRLAFSIFLMTFGMGLTLCRRAVAMLRGRDDVAYRAMTAFFFVFPLTLLLFGVATYARQPWPPMLALLVLICSGSALTLSVGYHLAARNLAEAQLALTLSFYYFGFWFMVIAVLFPDNASWPLVCVGLLLIAVTLHRSRAVALAESWALIAGDFEEYQQRWADLRTAHPGGVEGFDDALDRLDARLIEALASSSIAPTVAEATGRRSRDARTRRPAQVVGNLAVLFGQACKLDAYFQLAVTHWCAGLESALVHHAPVKRRARAIEKLWRSYRGDARRCIDLVRASITFATFDEMAQCLQRIRDDPRAAVVSAKNRFRPDFDAKTTAGYRNASLSVVLVDAVTAALGVQAHVCELQLGIAQIEQLKDSKNRASGDPENAHEDTAESGHQRYIRFRNLRAV